MTAEGYGQFVDGARQGHWVERTYPREGGLFPANTRAKGSYLKDKRNGQWTVETWMFLNGEVYWRHREGAFVMGRERGPWVEVTYWLNLDDSGDGAVPDVREGDAPRDHRRSEGSYADGKRDGRWVIIHHHGEVDLLQDGGFASGASFVRMEGTYSQGKPDGLWRNVLSSGVAILENFADGKWHGAYEVRDSDDSLLVAAKVSNDEVTELQFPQATPPALSADGSNGTLVVGAFGITFGPDTDQLKSLKCEPGSCLTHALWHLDGRLKNLGESDGWIPGVQNMPAPINRGGQYYEVFLSPWNGIAGLSGYLRFSSEEACRQEKARMDGLLREQYAMCQDHRYMPGSEQRTPIGQCDANGRPMAVVSTRCGTHHQSDSERGFKVWHRLQLTYQVIEPPERDAMIDAWKKKKSELSRIPQLNVETVAIH